MRFVFLLIFPASWAFIPPSPGSILQASRTSSSTLEMAAVGLFFGTSTGNTETCAEKIYQALGSDVCAEPVDVETIEGSLADAFGQHDALIVGTPTWNTGADTERSGTGWDELYYDKLPELQSILSGKKVAVFGLGDQVSYSENYADATGELFDVFQNLGCQMIGSWSQEGYEHEDSKSIRGDKFCGLLLDMVNQEDLTDERIERWVEQLKDEGLLDGAGAGTVVAASSAAPVAAAPAPSTFASSIEGDVQERLKELERENEILRKTLQAATNSNNEASSSSFPDGFTPHYNPVTKKTMWTSADGRRSYVTSD